MAGFSSMNATKKNQLIIVICATLLATYFGGWYPIISKDVDHQNNMVNRRQNRIEVRTGNVEMPKVSTRKLENKLRELERELSGTDGKLSDLSRRFTPLNTLEDVQSMRLEIAQLARLTGMDVQEMGGIGRGEGGSVSEVMKRATANQFGRPLITLRAKSTYPELLRFTRGLSDLAYNASVVNLDIGVLKTAADDGDSGSNHQANLIIKLLIAI